MNAEAFLQKYRVLEGLLEKRYEGKKINASSVVIEYIRDIDSEPVRVDLDLLREIRNILSHNAGKNGQPVIEPSDEMMERLEEVIHYVQLPCLAGACGTKAEHIFTAHLNDNVSNVMRSMRNNGYSHIPIIEHGSMIGVFSVHTVFDFLVESGLHALNTDTRMYDLRHLLPIDAHKNESYAFVSADTSVVELRDAFEQRSKKNNRLVAVFVTQNGSRDEPLVSLITPWDLLQDDCCS